MFGLHASPSSRFLSELSSHAPLLRILDLSIPGGLPPDQLLSLSIFTNLQEALVATSLFIFGKEVEKAFKDCGDESIGHATLSSSSSSTSTQFVPNTFDGPHLSTLRQKYLCDRNTNLVTNYQDPALIILLRNCFVECFLFHLPLVKLDSTLPCLKALRIPLHGSKGVANFCIERDCLERLVTRQSWKSSS